ncbi:hypothetical protein BJV74DRAFT_798398 [Russula compacta]|nr:hypothetical protein BJV74DRAFT_798398 [Russula compacta]
MTKSAKSKHKKEIRDNRLAMIRLQGACDGEYFFEFYPEHLDTAEISKETGQLKFIVPYFTMRSSFTVASLAESAALICLVKFGDNGEQTPKDGAGWLTDSEWVNKEMRK